MSFKSYFGHIPVLEGARSNSSIDPGGLTIYGLSQATRDAHGLDDNPTQEQIKNVYRVGYWLLYGCDKMPPIVAWLVCDVFVNHKPKTATVILQRALGSVKVDGKYGPKTKAALAAIEDNREFIKNYSFQRRGHYARRTGVLLKRYCTQLAKATSPIVIADLEEKIQEVITQEHGWQNRLDKLFDGLWQNGLLKREPSKPGEITETATAAVVAGAAVQVATGQSGGIAELIP